MFSLQGKGASKPAGNWFQHLGVLFECLNLRRGVNILLASLCFPQFWWRDECLSLTSSPGSSVGVECPVGQIFEEQGKNRFTSSPKRHTLQGKPRSLSLTVRGQKHEASCLLPPTETVKNRWRYTFPSSSVFMSRNENSFRSYERIRPDPRHLFKFCNYDSFYCEQLLAPCPNPQLEDRPLSAVRDRLFIVFAATLHIWGRSSFPNLTRHAVGG